MNNEHLSLQTFSHITKSILCVLAPYLIFTGCVPIQEQEIPVTLNVSANSLDFCCSGESKEISVSSNYYWTVIKDTDLSWLKVIPVSTFRGDVDGKERNIQISVIAENNTSTASRTATITFSSNAQGGPVKIITVTQEALPANLSASPSSLTFVHSGESKSFTITSNTNWTISSDASSWLTFSTTSGSGNETVTATAAANIGDSTRTATITVCVEGVNPLTLSVTQEAPNLSVSTSSLNFSSVNEEKTFTITSNTSWTITRNGATWLTVTPSSGSNDQTITIKASANPSPSQRMATLTISGNGTSRDLIVTQEAPSLSVSLSSLIYSSDNEEKTFAITSNTCWSITRNGATWLTVSPSSGTNNGTITVTADINPSPSPRTATLTIKGIGISQDISVTQSGNTRTVTEQEMVLVKGGTFTMGCTAEQGRDCYIFETPSHSVTLSDYYIGKYEVTQGLWKEIMGNNPSHFTGNDKYPVEKVSWYDIVGTNGASMEINGITYYANGFIYKLNQLTGKQYRLPTEAEWEFAARGGNDRKGYKYSGSNEVENVAWFYYNSEGRTHTVGGKKANELGIHDMSGNVYEWCSDWSGDYNSRAQTNPTGPASGAYRVIRGGGWYFDSPSTRVSCRGSASPDFSINFIGFRIALSSNSPTK